MLTKWPLYVDQLKDSMQNILLDTGATQTLERRELVDTNSFTEEYKVARGFNGSGSLSS